MILDNEPDLSVVAEAANGEAVEQGRHTEIDLVIMDVAMPLMTGLQAARELARRKPGLRILMLSMHDNEQYFFESLRRVHRLRLEVRGRPGSGGGLPGRHARRTVHLSRSRGTLVRTCGPAPSRRPIAARRAHPARAGSRQTHRRGRLSKEIIALLTISLKTVERHRSDIPQALGLKTVPSSPGTPFEPA